MRPKETSKHDYIFILNDLRMDETIQEMKHKLILHWNCRDLTEIPESMRNHGTRVKELYLKWNRLKTLPPWIDELVNVTDLYLYGNSIEELPMEFGQMKLLTVLDLTANRLQHLPRCVENLINLTRLILDDNFIRSLPNEINGLNNLQTLSVTGNKLIYLPDWIGSLPKLNDLNLDNNHLKELPNRLTLAKELTRISVRSNGLYYLPFNSFVSNPIVKFDSNDCLYYISYSLLVQLKSQLVDVIDDPPSFSCDHYCDYKNIKLPRRLIKAHEFNDNLTISLWELSLRIVYRLSKLFNYNDNCASYDFIKNGPTSVCVNSNCGELIFTEGWIVIGKTNRVRPSSIVALCCCKRCLGEFVQDSNVVASITWTY